MTVAGVRGREELCDLAPAELAARATSLSCRNFFRSLDMQPASSDSSSDSGDGSASSASSSASASRAGSSAAGSSDMRRCADGMPRSARQLSTLVRRGRTLPVRLTTSRGQTVGWSTVIANYELSPQQRRDDDDDEADAAGDSDDEADAFAMAGRADLLVYVSWMNVFRSPALLRDIITSKRRDKEVGYRALIERRRAWSPVERDAYFLDDPSMVGEQRVKRLNLASYCTSVMVFTDKEVERRDIDDRFWLKHPQCERNNVRLSGVRRVKGLLLQVALDHGSPIDISTVVHAVVYFERLVLSGFVFGDNRRVVAGVCMVLATKFNESGIVKQSEMQRKVTYVVGRMDDAFGVDRRTIFAWELRVLVALEFDLIVNEKAGLGYLVALLATRNILPVTYYGRYGDGENDSGSDSGDSTSS